MDSIIEAVSPQYEKDMAYSEREHKVVGDKEAIAILLFLPFLLSTLRQLLVSLTLLGSGFILLILFLF